MIVMVKLLQNEHTLEGALGCHYQSLCIQKCSFGYLFCYGPRQLREEENGIRFLFSFFWLLDVRKELLIKSLTS